MKVTKKIIADTNNDVIAIILRGTEEVDRKRFNYTDASFFVYLFGGETKQRESKFKSAHKWADDYLTQIEKYEV